MRLLILLSLGLLSSCLFGFTDLGTWGEQFDIAESIEFKTPKEPIVSEQQVQEAYTKGITSTQRLPKCQETRDRALDPTVVLDHDIEMPEYKISIKKGTKFNYLEYKKMSQYMLMIDGNNSEQIALAKHYKQASDVVIYNGSASVMEGYVNGHIYIADESFQRAFKVECLPSFYIQNETTFLIKEINMEDLGNKK